nr:hypothetical protein [Tanacetum cinerariifolium]
HIFDDPFPSRTLHRRHHHHHLRLNQLNSQWASDTLPESFSSVQVLDALVLLRTILESLDDLLDLAPSRDSLRRHPDWVEKVLEDFLVMVDVYGTFQMQISTLKQFGVIKEVIEVIIMISEAFFGGISGSFETRKTSWIMGLKKAKREKGIKELKNGIWSLRNINKYEVLNKEIMQQMEECIDGIESGSEKVFRSLINTRVSLLNVLTQ